MEFLWKKFGISLRLLACILAMLQMAVAYGKMMLFFLSYVAFDFGKSSPEESNDVSVASDAFFQLILITGFLFQLFWFALNVILLKAVIRNNYETLSRAWTLMLGAILIVIALKICGVAFLGGLELREVVILGFDIGVDLVTLWVVAAYKEELKQKAGNNTDQQKEKQSQEDKLEKC